MLCVCCFYDIGMTRTARAREGVQSGGREMMRLPYASSYRSYVVDHRIFYFLCLSLLLLFCRARIDAELNETGYQLDGDRQTDLSEIVRGLSWATSLFCTFSIPLLYYSEPFEIQGIRNSVCQLVDALPALQSGRWSSSDTCTILSYRERKSNN